MDPRIEELLQDPEIRALYNKIHPEDKERALHDGALLTTWAEYINGAGPDGADRTKEVLDEFGVQRGALTSFGRSVIKLLLEDNQLDVRDDDDLLALFLMGMAVGGRIIREQDDKMVEEVEKLVQETRKER